MYMSDKAKENLRYGGIISAMLLIFGFYLNVKKDDELEFNRKFDLVYQVALTQGLRDTLQTRDIAALAARLAAHELETEKSFTRIQQSMLDSKIQLTTAEIQDQYKISQGNRN